MSVSEYTW